MSYKMKGFSGFKSSPVKKSKKKDKNKGFDFSKKADYSKEKLEGNIGSKIAKAVIPTSVLDLAPIGKAAKLAKLTYNYFNPKSS